MKVPIKYRLLTNRHSVYSNQCILIVKKTHEIDQLERSHQMNQKSTVTGTDVSGP